jgi:hypothetical protein
MGEDQVARLEQRSCPDIGLDLRARVADHSGHTSSCLPGTDVAFGIADDP